MYLIVLCCSFAERLRTSVDKWWVFHYVHLDHVDLRNSVPVSVQAAPFQNVAYNVSLRRVCCVEAEVEDPEEIPSFDEERFRSTQYRNCQVCGEAVSSLILSSEEINDVISRDAPQYLDPLLLATLPYPSSIPSTALLRVTVTMVSLQCNDNLTCVNLLRASKCSESNTTCHLSSLPTECLGGCRVASSPVFQVASVPLYKLLVVGIVVRERKKRIFRPIK